MSAAPFIIFVATVTLIVFIISGFYRKNISRTSRTVKSQYGYIDDPLEAPSSFIGTHRYFVRRDESNNLPLSDRNFSDKMRELQNEKQSSQDGMECIVCGEQCERSFGTQEPGPIYIEEWQAKTFFWKSFSTDYLKTVEAYCPEHSIREKFISNYKPPSKEVERGTVDIND